MSRSVLEYLRHILEETHFILSQSSDLEKCDFINNPTLKRAFVRSIEIIGEAVKQIPDDMRSKYPEIEWRALAGMRDRLVHAYFGVDYDIVWDVVKNKIPILDADIKSILEQDFS